MSTIAEMGHEVGYHYETLDLCEGDFDEAEALFRRQLKDFREAGIDIQTVCMHGNPRRRKTGYTRNSDLFKDRFDVLRQEYDLLGEAYFLPDSEGLEYISDVGIRFSAGWGESVGGLMEILREKRPQRSCLLIHPDYWSRSSLRAGLLYTGGWLIRKSGVNTVLANIRSALS
jgi:hypothetical protein